MVSVRTSTERLSVSTRLTNREQRKQESDNKESNAEHFRMFVSRVQNPIVGYEVAQHGCDSVETTGNKVHSSCEVKEKNRSKRRAVSCAACATTMKESTGFANR